MLRQFAGLWIVFFGALAIWYGVVRNSPGTAAVLGGLAVTIGPLGLMAPSVIRPIFIAWTVLVFPIGWTVSRVVLLFLFFAIVTPLALVFRLRGRDVLGLRRRTGATTYWNRKPAAPDLASYFRQS
jgi:hypothetical protein